MSQFLRRILSLALLLAGLLFMLVVSLGLTLWTLLGDDVPVFQRGICALNLSADCVFAAAEAKAQAAQNKAARIIADAEAQIRAKEVELAALEVERTTLEALRNRLEKIEHSASTYSIFHHHHRGRYTVVTGHGYKSALEPNQLNDAWCYIDIRDRGGNAARTIYVVRYEPNKRITSQTLPQDVLDELGIDEAVLAGFLARCRWPEGAV